MYNYGFNLDFGELSQELQDQKIDEYMQFEYSHNSEAENLKEEYGITSLEEYLEHHESRDKARHYIEVHFPLYF